jgi:cytochrome c peroxidase
MSGAAQRGLALFMSERLECFHCHGGFNFTDSVDHQGSVSPELAFHNTGLYHVDGGYPEGAQGLFEITDDPADRGRFRAPTLRNVAVTAPYMHDGSIETLGGVIDHYAMGGRTLAAGPNQGVGADNPLKSKFVSGFILSPRERADLIAFLESLTDADFLSDPRYSDPFAAAE